jgi:hypothetical protein
MLCDLIYYIRSYVSFQDYLKTAVAGVMKALEKGNLEKRRAEGEDVRRHIIDTGQSHDPTVFFSLQ